MVSSITNNINNDIQSLLNDFKNKLEEVDFEKDFESAGMAAFCDKDTLKSFANINLHEALKNADNSVSNNELLSCIPKILENASSKDLARYITKSQSGILSSVDGLNELIKTTGLDNDPECQNFLAEATKNAIEKLLKELNSVNSLNELLKENDEIQSLFDMMEKYNENLKSNLVMKYETQF